MAYTERLKACKLPTLHFRHIRGDMIEMYKILSGKYDTSLHNRLIMTTALSLQGIIRVKNDLCLQLYWTIKMYYH